MRVPNWVPWVAVLGCLTWGCGSSSSPDNGDESAEQEPTNRNVSASYEELFGPEEVQTTEGSVERTSPALHPDLAPEGSRSFSPPIERDPTPAPMISRSDAGLERDAGSRADGGVSGLDAAMR